MLSTRRGCLFMAAQAAVVGVPFARHVQAQSNAVWPSKALKLIVPYPSGGVTDAAARLLAERMSLALGKPMVVENRAGAGGILGMDALAKSSDGHTLALSAISPLSLLPHLAPVPFDPQKDFTPVGSLMYSPVYVLATSAFTGHRFEDVISQSKATPGKLSMATSGIGSVGHIMLEQIKRKAGVDVVHIPYKGGGSQVIADAVSGQFELFTSNPSPNLNGFIAQGKLRVLAVTGPARLPTAPDRPTLAELGMPLANLTSLFGMFASSKMPADHVERIHLELTKVMAAKEFQDRLTRLDNVVQSGSAASFAAIIQAESQANAKIIKDAGIRLE